MSQSIFEEIFGRANGLDRPAILGPEACTYGELIADAEGLARLFKRHGLRDLQTLGLAVPQSRAYATTVLAAWRAGLVVAPVNPKAPHAEQEFVLGNAGAEYLVTTPADRHFIERLGGETLETDGRIILGRIPGKPRTDAMTGDRVIISTSGSTNRPKGVILTDKSISANVRAVADSIALSAADRGALFTPSSYSYAISQAFTHLWSGAAYLPWPTGLLFPVDLLKAMNETGTTGVHANPTIFEMLHAAGGPPVETVRYVLTVGQPLVSTAARRIKATFPRARIVNMYGCTECSPRIGFRWIPDDIPDRETCWPVGKALDGMTIKIVREDGSAVETGELGEVYVSGSSVMRGYVGDAALTKAQLSDGWFRTMDIGFFDENGELNLRGRVDNIISVGHEKVAPEEVEDVIFQVNGVREVAVSAVPDAVLQFIPVALLAIDGDWEDVVQRVQAACSKNLSRAKIPRKFVPVSNLDRTPYGKIDRRAAREVANRLLMN